jgi:ornithine cyclodeaminase/alanine dehydrogenase-like protein (mu-crystallin family)
MTLYIRDEDILGLITFNDVIEAVEDAYKQYGLGLAGGNSLEKDCSIIPRTEMRVEGKDLPHISPGIRAVHQDMAYLEKTGNIFIRWGYHLGKKRGSFQVLVDANSGDLLAIFKAPRTQWMRTGAAGAVGAKYLSKENSTIAGVLGTGRQGRSQIIALSKVRNLEKVYCHSGRKKDQEYAKEMSKLLGIDVIACDNVEDVVKSSDILITATMSTEPLVKGKWIDEGMHITAIGADDPLKVELDAYTLKKADKLVIDYYLALHTKEIRDPLNKGLIEEKNIYGNIGEIVAKIKPSREHDKEITIYKNTGMCLPYVAINTMVLNKVKNSGLGIEVNENINKIIFS